jgi:drug/metabolite transporter (DMT)-like permease
MFAAFLTTFLFALSAVSASRSTRVLGGVEANFWRITLATVVLGVWAHWMGSGLRGAGFLLFLWSGLVGFGIGDLALFQAYPRIGARLTILLVHCLAAPFAAVVEWLWLGTVLTPMQILSSVIILAGVALALAPEKGAKIPRAVFWAGIVFAVLAAWGQGMGAVLSRKAYLVTDLAGESIDGMSAAYQRIIAGWVVGFAMFLLVIWRARTRGMAPGVKLPQHWRISWHWILLNGMTGPALGVSCFQWALSTQPTGVVLPIVATTPLVVIPLARWLEGERAGLRSIVGGFLAVVGAVLLAGATVK